MMSNFINFLIYVFMANLNHLQGHEAHLARSGFDLGQEFAFTSSTGMILPVYQDVLNVGESVYFSGELFARTQPLVTAAMADVDVYLDWFFVPISMLYTLFPSLRYQTNDLISSFYTSLSTAQSGNLPLLNMGAGNQLTPANFNTFDVVDSTTTTTNVNGECKGKSYVRLMSHLGFDPYAPLPSGVSPGVTNLPSNPNVFPLFALAYQAIWSDYYRVPLDDYFRRDVACFNVDKHYNSAMISSSYFPEFFRLRYRPRHKDYFSSAFVSPMLSTVNALGTVDQSFNINQFKSLHDYLNTTSSTGVGLSNENPSLQVPTVGRANDGITQSLASTLYGTVSNNVANTRLSTGAIRDLFAFDKLMRIVGRAKKDYDSQVLAHFGYKVPRDIKHQLTHLYTQHGLLHIGEVVSSADTYNSSSGSGSALGQISGQGYVNITGKSRKFTAPCDGVLMCCYSAVPRVRYIDTFDKLNSITSISDFYTPEFDKLGMQPIYRYEADVFTSGYTDGSARYGWQFRYSQFKRKYSRLSVAFSNVVRDSLIGSINYNSSWVVGMRPYGSVFSIASEFNPQGYVKEPKTNPYVLLASPHDLDSIMQMPYQGTFDWSVYGYNSSTGTWDTDKAKKFQPGVLFYTDPFINGFRANVKKVSTMSPYGEPDLDQF